MTTLTKDFQSTHENILMQRHLQWLDHQITWRSNTIYARNKLGLDNSNIAKDVNYFKSIRRIMKKRT